MAIPSRYRGAVLRRFLQAVSLLVLLALGAMLAAPFTATGSRALADLANRFFPVDIRYQSGALFGELELASVSVSLESLSLRLDGVRSEMDPGCLLGSRLCWRRLGAAAVVLEISGDDLPAEEAPRRQLLELPFGLSAEALKVDRLDITWPGGSWVSDLDASLVLAGSQLSVARLAVAHAQLTLIDDESEPALTPSTRAGVIDPPRTVLPEVFLPLHIAVETASLDRLTLVTSSLESRFESLELVAQWEGHALTVERLAVVHETWGEGVAAFTLTYRDEWPLSVHAVVDLAGSGYPVELQRYRAELGVDGSLGGLEVSLREPDAQAIDLQADLDILDNEMPFLVQGIVRWERAPALTDWVAHRLENVGDIQLQEPLELRARGNRTQQRLELTGGASGLGYRDMRVDLRGEHRAGQLRIDRLHLEDAAGHRASASGTLETGPTLTWDVLLSARDFTLPDYPGVPQGIVSGELAVAGERSRGGWRVEVSNADLAGEVGGQPATIRGRAQLDSDTLVGDAELQAVINGAQLELQNPSKAGAELTLVIDDLSRWAEDAYGSLEATGRLVDQGRQLRLEGRSSALGWNDWSGRGLEFSGDHALTADRLPDLDLRLAEFSGSGLTASNISLRGGGALARHRFQLSSSGDLDGTLAISGGMTAGGWHGVLAAAALGTPLGSWTLPESVDLRWVAEQETLVVADHCWLQAGARLCAGNLRLGTATGQASLAYEGDVGQLVGSLADDFSVSSRIDVQLDLDWSPGGGVRVAGAASTQSGRLMRLQGGEETGTLRWGPSSADFDWADGALDWRSRLAVLDGTVSAVLALPDTGDGELAGEVLLEGLQLRELASAVPGVAATGGELNGAIDLGGTVDAPLLEGRVLLADGRFTSEQLPTELVSLNLAIDFAGATAGIEGQGVLGGGPIAFDGVSEWADEPGITLNISGRKQTLRRPPSLELQVSEQLTLTADPRSLSVRGEIEVTDGRFEFDSLAPGGVSLSRDVVVVDAKVEPENIAQALNTELDIDVTIDERFQIIGDTLNANIGGQLNLTQRPGLPLELFGNLNVIGGELDVYGQRLLVKRGSVSFTGPPEMPELNLRAERNIRAENVTAGVWVRGPADALELEIYADPAMPQTEALSYLTRGRGLDSGAGSGVDAAAVAVSMGMGALNRTAVVRGLERLPGVSNVEFGTGQLEEETTATVSGYLGERIYLSYGIGLNEPVNVLTGRLYLKTRLWLEMVSALENSLDIYYSFDID